jgi:vitamin B12 transporter
VQNVAGPPPAVYFVTLVNPYNPPSVIPPGLTLVQTDAFFGPSYSLDLTERKIAGYQGTLSYHGGALVFGYDYQDQSAVISGVPASRTNNGFFANVQQNFGRRVFLSGGGRVEHSSAFGTIGSGRGGASFLLLGEHGPLSSTLFRLSAGRGVTEPSLLENYAQVPPFEIGNPALRPETTTTFEAALVSEWWGRRIKTEVAGFRNSFHNLIAYVEPTWENIEASWARGVETSAQARVTNNILITGSYTRLYTDITASTTPESSDTGIGEPLVRRPRNSGSMSIAITPKRWSLVIGGSFVGERQDADFTFGVTRNPGYENIYASASYDVAKHFTPFLKVNNLLNERYEEVLGYQALSRNILGGVRIHW